MTEKKSHYYISCIAYAQNAVDHFDVLIDRPILLVEVVMLLGHIADRLGDLVLAVEQSTQTQMYPPPE